MKWLASLTAAILVATPLAAQSEQVLKDYFEGRIVTLKIAMPGTEDGVDVYPGSPRPIDYARYADRLKDFGTAIKPGEQVIVTKIKLKSRLIEFQLGGGGYGTFGDETSTGVGITPAPKTARERNLEAEIKREKDPSRKRAIKEELDMLKAEREREDARNRAAVAEAVEHRKQNVRQRRLEGGSRFNLRYHDRVPPEALTPESMMAALGQYVDFGTAVGSRPGEPFRRAGLVRKGMLLADVDAVLGVPSYSSERKEGTLRVHSRTYPTPEGRLSAEFVEGVLFRYLVTSD